MKNKVSHGSMKDPEPENGRYMMAGDMNPGSLMLAEGQEFMVYGYDPEMKKKQNKYIKIIKLYRHHALCRINGKRMECFAYAELYTMKAGGSSA